MKRKKTADQPPVLPGMFPDAPVAPPAPRTILIYRATLGSGICKGCKARIEWAVVVRTERKMCFDRPLKVLRSYRESEKGRWIDVVDFDTNHWATCPNRAQFQRRTNR